MNYLFAGARRAAGLLAAGALALSVSAHGHNLNLSKADEAVRYRQAQMTLVGTYFGDMGAMVKGKQPFDAKVFLTNAERLTAVTRWAEGFDSKSLTADSKAKEEIWKDKAEFDRLMMELGEHADKLKAAAASGDLKASIPAFKAMADNCGACHKKFKNK